MRQLALLTITVNMQILPSTKTIEPLLLIVPGEA